MSSFSEKYGFKEQQPIQINDADDALRSRLWNYFYAQELNDSQGRFGFSFGSKLGIVEQILDRFGICYEDPDKALGDENNQNTLKNLVLKGEWNEVYDFITYYLEFAQEEHAKEVAEGLNRILEDQKSGYRIVTVPNDSFEDCPIAPITNEQELEELRHSLNTDYLSVDQSMHKAVSHYSDRTNPNYADSIKSSLDALESLLSNITGKDYTLSKNLKELKKSNIDIHPAFLEALDKLFGFASDTVRHGGKDISPYADEPTARYCLITCSAAINYLISELCEPNVLDDGDDDV